MGSAIIFVGAAFPFIIPLVPSADTQPTFALFVLAFAILAAIASLNWSVWLRKRDIYLATAVVGSGLTWLAASIFLSGYNLENINRIISYIMFLVSLLAGMLNPDIFSARRLTLALKFYIVFTAIFFLTHGALEDILIQSRGVGAASSLSELGRGAATLSPEPSFFAFQIFSLFLVARLTTWQDLSTRGRHLIQLMTITLLLSSLGGYGILYAATIVALSGWRYILTTVVAGLAGFVFLIGKYGVESLRFVKLFASLATDVTSEGNLTISDMSALERLHSFVQYYQAFSAHPWFGDAFATYGGGGLISLPASLGLFGLGLILLFLVAIVTLRIAVRVKVALLVWFIAQFISGPIGLPLVGLIIGLVIARSRIGAIFVAIRPAYRGSSRHGGSTLDGLASE